VNRIRSAVALRRRQFGLKDVARSIVICLEAPLYEHAIRTAMPTICGGACVARRREPVNSHWPFRLDDTTKLDHSPKHGFLVGRQPQAEPRSTSTPCCK